MISYTEDNRCDAFYQVKKLYIFKLDECMQKFLFQTIGPPGITYVR